MEEWLQNEVKHQDINLLKAKLHPPTKTYFKKRWKGLILAITGKQN